MGLSDRTLIAIIAIIMIIVSWEKGINYIYIYIAIKKISISQLISDGIRDIGSRSVDRSGVSKMGVHHMPYGNKPTRRAREGKREGEGERGCYV